MVDTYLTSSFKDKEKVKALGARWDAEQRQWFVPAGHDLAPFAAWLPDMAQQATSNSTTTSVAMRAEPASAELTVQKRGATLSQLLAGVSQAIAQAFKAGVWTMVEVVDARLRNGHVYIEMSERDARGAVLAKADAVIWASTAARILPEFERATGAKVAPGIKLLVRARPVFKAQFGFSLEIDAIDPEYTLGDLEAKKREIRTRLQREGLFDANRKLPQPWDYNVVLVVAPQGGAGLGDFQAEAERLERFGICAFTYVNSRFQGEGAAAEIRAALLEALDALKASGSQLPDAVAVIRGGGAVNDLAWLNDYELARCICELDVPVLTGIGHERDSTVLDEVANMRFDTPSKVVTGIEQVIIKRVGEARTNFEQVAKAAARSAQLMRRTVDQADTAVKSGTHRHLAFARERAAELISEVRVGSLQAVRNASDGSREFFFEVRQLAVEQLSDARQVVPALLAEVRSEARQAVRTAKGEARANLDVVFERSALDARRAREAAERGFLDVAANARRVVGEAAIKSEALVREIAGQGPEKTLGRGFAIVHSEDGRTITGAAQAVPGAGIQIQFRDGSVAARTNDNQNGDSR